MSRGVKLAVCVLLPLLVLSVPTRWIPIAGITVVEHRLIAIFLMAALSWILEPVPVFATSVLIIVFELLLVSDRGVFCFTCGQGEPGFGTLLSHREVMGTFASPIVMLFLGGFFLAMSATKYRLDVNLARILLRPFGSQPRFVLLGLMLITAAFSMFMSNTATTAMMLAILTPILAVFEPDDPGKIGFALAIPFAANVGGMGTPIGTPPNAVSLKYLTGEIAVSFGQWVAFAVPFVLVLLMFTWWLLWRTYPARTQSLRIDMRGRFVRDWRAVTAYVTSAGTILLWLFDFLHGMNAYVVAMIPVALFSVTGIVGPEDLKRIRWDVLWLVAGGIALGLGLEETGLARHFIQSIPLASLPPHLIVVCAIGVTLGMASLMSNTATANLLLPIVAALGASLPSLAPIGGQKMLILVVAFSCSMAMPLPVSTPPNAMAYATGLIESRHMARSGVAVGGAGVILAYGLIYTLRWVGFL